MVLNPKFEKYLQFDWDAVYNVGAYKLRELYAKQMSEGKIDIQEVHSVEDRIVKTSVRETLIRIYNPEARETDGVFIWMHGGGFVLGDIEHGDATCRQITNKLKCTVISIEYGLCPPHKFPDPENECYEIVKWVYKNSEELKINPDKICLGGDSAGGSLVAAICLMAKEKKEFSIAHHVVVYACLDWNDMGERQSRKDNGKGYRLTTYGCEWHNHHHLRDRAVDGLNPLASPLLAKDFSNLPPVLVITCEYCILRDENLDYAKALSDAGVEAHVKNYPGLIHGFLQMRQLGIGEEIDDAINLICEKVGIAMNK